MSRLSRADAKRLAKRFTVTDGRGFRLSHINPGDTGHAKSKEHAEDLLARDLDRLRMLQGKLYAESTWSLLLIFQAMDAAGKDSIISHVMSGVNPEGCQVYSFKQPSSEELAHDFLWRTTRCLPERGRIGIFNRSYYEEVLVVRVHPELLDAQRLPAPLAPPGRIWNASRTSTRSNGTCTAAARSSASSSCMRRRRSRRRASSSGSTSRTRTGNSPSGTWRNGAAGTTTWRRTRR